MAWNPIETAPKNRMIDLWVKGSLYGPGRRLFNCRWIDEFDNGSLKGGWYFGVFSQENGDQIAWERLITGEATHWMDVPSDPE